MVKICCLENLADMLRWGLAWGVAEGWGVARKSRLLAVRREAGAGARQ